MKWIRLLAVLSCLWLLIGISAAEDEASSSAELVQFAVDIMGDTNQDALVSGFDDANSQQIGYSSDGKVVQSVSYSNIGNGSIIQWGESGSMNREERTMTLESVGDSGFVWQWNKGEVDQTINLRNSENMYLKQIVGGLKNILFPDEKQVQEQEQGTWTFCGTPVNGRGGLPLCAQKMADKIFKGKATQRDIYLLQYLEEYYDVFPSDDRTPHVTLTKWNITQKDDNLVLKFDAYNFGKEAYNATLSLSMMPTNKKIIDLDGGDGNIKITADNVVHLNFEDIPTEQQGQDNARTIQVGSYRVSKQKGLEEEVIIPLNGLKIKNVELLLSSE